MKKVVRILVLMVAVIGSMTPSQYGLYNPVCPVKLKLNNPYKKNVH